MSLPSGWSLASIGDVSEGRVEQGAPTKAFRYIDIGSIDRASKRVGDASLVEPAAAPTRARQWVRAGDVLVSMTRPNLNAVAIVDDALDGAIASTGFDVLRAKGVLPKWLYYRVRSDAFVRDICGGVQGVVYPAVRPADIRRHVLPLAPIAEQARIVEAIESHLSRLDDAVASLKRAQARLKAYRASVLKAAVEGRLVPTEAALARAEKREYEPADVLLARILAERRRRWEEAELAKMIAADKPPKDDKWKARYEESTPPALSGLPRLPHGWVWSSLEQLLTSPLANGRSVRSGGGMPVLRLTAIRGGAVLLSEAKTGAWDINPFPFLVAQGDFLIVRGNGSLDLVGRAGLVGVVTESVAFPDTLIRARLTDQIELPFLKHIWDSRLVRRHVEGSAKTTAGIYKVNQTDLARTPIPLPPKAEQQRIAEAIEQHDSLARESLKALSHSLVRCRRLRQAILRWAFDGKLADQNPSDEPAAVPLQCRKERDGQDATAGARERGSVSRLGAVRCRT